MTNQQINTKFLQAIEHEAATNILDSIAKHYGASHIDILEEVTGNEAEYLLDYMVEPHRTAASLLMQRHGFR